MLRVLSSDFVSVIDSFLWFSTFLFVKGSRRRLPIRSSSVAGPTSLNVCCLEIHFGLPISLSSLQLLVECVLHSSVLCSFLR